MADGALLRKSRTRRLDRLLSRHERIGAFKGVDLEPVFDIIRAIMNEDESTSMEAIANDLMDDFSDHLLERMPALNGILSVFPGWGLLMEAIVTIAQHRVEILEFRINRLERKLGLPTTDF